MYRLSARSVWHITLRELYVGTTFRIQKPEALQKMTKIAVKFAREDMVFRQHLIIH